MTKDLAMLVKGCGADGVKSGVDYLNTEAFMDSIDAHFRAEWSKIMS